MGPCPIRTEGCPWKRKKRYQEYVHMEKRLCEITEKMVICKFGRETSGETNPADTLISDFQPNYEKRNLLFKPPSMWHFVMVALGN